MSLYGSFEIGKKALTTSQLGQSTTGHNIANVDTEGFSRQEVSQAASRPTTDGKGTGVDITGVYRKHDGFTKQKVVDEQTNVGSWSTKEKVLTEAEVIYTDLEGTRLRGAMDEFWSSWSSVATEPESATHRKALLVKGQELATNFQSFDRRLTEFSETLNARLSSEIVEVNQITREIGMLNKQVEQLERRGFQANDARDRREALLQQLAEKIEIRSFESERGTLEIQIANGAHLVHGRDNYALHPIKVVEGNGNIRIGLDTSEGIQSDVTDTVKSGGIKELINQRDGNIKEYQIQLNEMVEELAFRVNQIHTKGTGLNSARFEETSAYQMNIERQGRPLPNLKTGDFDFKILDEDNDIDEVITVHLEAGEETLESVVEKINQAADAFETIGEGENQQTVIKKNPKFKAELNEDGTITLNSGLGKRFIHGKDETNIMTVLGLNCFFHTGDGARDIEVNAELLDDEMKIATGMDMVPGDNQVALEVAELQLAATMNDETITFDEYYNKQITDVGLKVQDAQKGLTSHTQMLEQYEVLRDSVSSVNLDEEMTRMVKYQRAYESSAKFLSTVDQMTQTVINM